MKVYAWLIDWLNPRSGKIAPRGWFPGGGGVQKVTEHRGIIQWCKKCWKSKERWEGRREFFIKIRFPSNFDRFQVDNSARIGGSKVRTMNAASSTRKMRWTICRAWNLWARWWAPPWPLSPRDCPPHTPTWQRCLMQGTYRCERKNFVFKFLLFFDLFEEEFWFDLPFAFVFFPTKNWDCEMLHLLVRKNSTSSRLLPFSRFVSSKFFLRVQLALLGCLFVTLWFCRCVIILFMFFPLRLVSGTRICLKVCAPRGCYEVCALSCYSTLDWLIEYEDMPQSLCTPMLFNAWLIDWLIEYEDMPQSLRIRMLFNAWLIDWLIEYEDMPQSLRTPCLLRSLRTRMLFNGWLIDWVNIACAFSIFSRQPA